MTIASARYAVLIATAVALNLTGCTKQKTDVGEANPALDTISGGVAVTSVYSDAHIAALLDEANRADSAAGAYAMSKATDHDVRDYAKDMMEDHHDLRAKGQETARKMNLTPASPGVDPVARAAQKEMKALKEAPAGAQFDRTYIEQEIAMHQQVIYLATQLQASAQDKELRDLVKDALPVLQKHLEKAQELQKKLNS
jgi:putative membrane protein